MPPTSVEMVGHARGSKIQIKENEEVTLTCQVSNSKPKADIFWYRRDIRFIPGTMENTDEDGSIEGRKTVTSKITFRVTARDNQAHISCEAKHPAIKSSLRPMRATVQLSVMCKFCLTKRIENLLECKT